MSDLDPEFETEHERELWIASVARLREHAEDPQAEQGLDRLAAQILAQHRLEGGHSAGLPRADGVVPSLPPVRSRSAPSRSAPMMVGAALVGLAAAAAIAVIVLATQSKDERPEISVEQPTSTPDEPSERVEPPPPARLGPPLEQAGLLTFRVGPVEQTTEVAAAIEPGATIQPGTTLATAPEGETCMRWTAPFALVCVEGNARVELLAAESSTRRLRLHAGRLVAVLDPLAPGQRFEVVTSLGSVAAIGTVFVVEVGEVAIEASVFEGEVEVREPERVRSLLAGSSLRLGSRDDAIPLDPEVRVRAEALSARAELWRESIESLGFVEFEATRAVDLDGHPLSAGPLALLLTAGAHRLHLGPDRELALDVVAGEREQLGSLPTSKPSKPSNPVEPSAAELARLAQQHRMARNYPETARLYQALIDRYPESPEAANVPVRLGDLLLKTGDHEGALAAYDRYLERGGELEPEARFGRIKALRALGRDEAEADAIAEFLREHGDDYRVNELEL